MLSMVASSSFSGYNVWILRPRAATNAVRNENKVREWTTKERGQ
jgi:hypothetical protein